MGIKGLIPFISEKVPASISELSLESLSGEYVAVDASTALYQFTVAIRDSSYFSTLVNSNGETTSHIYGLMNRCSRLLECGIKPVFVFDSKPPELKLRTLSKRKKRREEAAVNLKNALAEGDKESIKKFVGSSVKVTKEMNDSAKKLLRLMGVPVIEALEEAEAQCAHLVRNNLCRFVASEDTDTLVFGGPFLLKNVTTTGNKKIVKVDLEKVLAGLELEFEQFVDFCMLCGCDYCDALEGVGPKTAYSLVKKHGNLEEIVNLKGGNYEEFAEAKKYFLAPKVNDYDPNSVKMGNLDPDALTDFLVIENNFSKPRVDKFVEKLMKLKNKKVQTSLLSFLTQSQPTTKAAGASKRARTAKPAEDCTTVTLKPLKSSGLKGARVEPPEVVTKTWAERKLEAKESRERQKKRKTPFNVNRVEAGKPEDKKERSQEERPPVVEVVDNHPEETSHKPAQKDREDFGEADLFKDVDDEPAERQHEQQEEQHAEQHEEHQVEKPVHDQEKRPKQRLENNQVEQQQEQPAEQPKQQPEQPEQQPEQHQPEQPAEQQPEQQPERLSQGTQTYKDTQYEEACGVAAETSKTDEELPSTHSRETMPEVVEISSSDAEDEPRDDKRARDETQNSQKEYYRDQLLQNNCKLVINNLKRRKSDAVEERDNVVILDDNEMDLSAFKSRKVLEDEDLTTASDNLDCGKRA